MRRLLAVLSVLLLAPAAAHAQSGFVDLYFIPSAKIDVTVPGFGSGDDTGTGFGVKGLVPADSLALTGEYQGTSYDDSDIDFDQLRVGLGFIGPTTSGLFAEYVNMTIDDADADGFAFHARFSGAPANAVSLYGQIGYVMIEDDFEESSGPEFSIGLVFTPGGSMGAFVDLRRTSLEGEDSAVEYEFTDIRAGLRLKF